MMYMIACVVIRDWIVIVFCNACSGIPLLLHQWNKMWLNLLQKLLRLSREILFGACLENMGYRLRQLRRLMGSQLIPSMLGRSLPSLSPTTFVSFILIYT
ncbi:hypothetical protein C2S51_003872 [Perilla frutescens var. frutescens]|nr:hypothetical protein C2S51_003872 [Perilla frutescens var. frutescens]